MVLTLMTLNDFERPKIERFSVLHFVAATHISRVNCAEMAKDRPGQPAGI